MTISMDSYPAVEDADYTAHNESEECCECGCTVALACLTADLPSGDWFCDDCVHLIGTRKPFIPKWLSSVWTRQTSLRPLAVPALGLVLTMLVSVSPLAHHAAFSRFVERGDNSILLTCMFLYMAQVFS
jgi:hypothetical protein